MIFVDSGFFVALLTMRDQLHSRAESWSEHLSESFVTTDYVIWETVNWLSAPTNRAKIHDVIDDIQKDSRWEVIAATKQLFNVGLAMHRHYADKEWSLTDCISFHLMREREISRALTHDHHFEQAGFEALLRRNPA